MAKYLISFFALVLLTYPAMAHGKSKNYHASRSCLPASVKAELRKLEKKFGKVRIISTYRKNARVKKTGRRSKHASCRAVDFKIRNKKAAWKYIRRTWKGGAGVYYGRLNHIHIDNGRRARWVN